MRTSTIEKVLVVLDIATVFVWSVREYWPTVDLRLVGSRSRRPDLTGEEANLMDYPALGEGVLKR
jgi:hypothetical protein